MVGSLASTLSASLTAQMAGTSVSPQLTATLTLVDESGVPMANLTNLKCCWFDQVTPDLFQAPTDVSSTETTSGSGVFAFPIPNSTLTTGQTGWLVVTNSDGTEGQNPAHLAFAGPLDVT